MNNNPTLKFRVRCRENLEVWSDDDPLEYFNTLEEAAEWARRVANAGRFNHLIIQNMSGGRWVVLDEIFVPKSRKPK